MTRYVAIPSGPKGYDYWEEPAPTSQTIYAEDDAPQQTGLYDANGVPLYRVRDKIRVGFTK